MDYRLVTPITIILRLLETAVEFYMASALLSKKSSPKNFFISIILFTFLTGTAQLFIPQTFSWIFIPLIGVPILSLTLNAKWVITTFAYLLTMIIVALLDLLYSSLLVQYLQLASFDELFLHTNYYYLDMLLISSSIFLISLFIIFLKKHISIVNFIKFNKKSVLINSLISFVCILSNMLVLILYFDKKALPLWIIFVNIASMTLQLCISLYNTDNKVKLIRSEQKLEQQIDYNSKQKASIDNFRKFRHDYKNTIQTISSYAETGHLEKIQHMMPEVNKEINSLSIDSLDPNLIKNPDLYAIINPKYRECIERNVPINFDIKSDIETLNIDNYNLTKILGIFLDNAIYAASNSLIPLIEITLSEKENIAFIKISNTYRGTIPPYEQIFSKGFSTKGTDRGIGLYEVKDILSKYPNINLITTHDKNFFNQELIIPMS